MQAFWMTEDGNCLGLQVTYRFVSVLNEQGFIEGRYVPVIDGQAMTPQIPTPPTNLGSNNGDGSVRKEGETDVPASEPAPIK